MASNQHELNRRFTLEGFPVYHSTNINTGEHADVRHQTAGKLSVNIK